MRVVVALSVAVILFLIGSGNLKANNQETVDDGTKIRQSLDEIINNRLPIEIMFIDRKPRVIGVGRPETIVVKDSLLLASGCCGDAVRARLAELLQAKHGSAPPPTVQPASEFTPDFCIFFQNQQRESRNLWISSSQLEMKYFGSDGSHYQCGIEAARPSDLSDQLAAIPDLAKKVPMKAYKCIRWVATQIEESANGKPLPLDLLAIDPKQVPDLRANKRWSVLGKVSISASQADNFDRTRVSDALSIALTRPIPDPFRSKNADDPEPPVDFTARAFTPRLALSVYIPAQAIPPNPLTKHYIVLMSFECHLAELYINDQFKGCCAISSGLNVNPSEQKLGQSRAPDQVLYNLLEAAGQTVRPKPAS